MGRTSLLYILVSGICSILVSCKPADYVGRYELKRVPKTSIELMQNGTFVFTSMYRNPYLHPFDHPDEYYFTTTGLWNVRDSKLILNSFADSLETHTPEIIANRILEDQSLDTTSLAFGRELIGHSTVTFFDNLNDTIDVLSVRFPDGTSVARLHRSMRYADWYTQLSDTAEFHFFGYPPFTMTRNDKMRREMKIRLYSAYRPNIFREKELTINRKKIRDHGFIFLKRKTFPRF